MSSNFGRLVQSVLVAGLLIGGTVVYFVWQKSAQPPHAGSGTPNGVAQDEAQSKPEESAQSEPQEGASLKLDDKTQAAMAVFQRLSAGKALAEEGKYTEALAIFEEIVRTASGTRYAWDAEIQAASALAGLKRFKEAQTRFDRILATCKIEEIEPQAKIAKADALSQAGEHESAIKLLEELMVTYAESVPLICEHTLGTMIVIYKRTGQFGLMRAALARIIEDYPGTEDFKGRSAQRDTAALLDQMETAQKPVVEKLLADKKLVAPAKLAAGQNTWKAGEGPYLVAQPLTVGADQTLTIEAGTTVRFAVRAGLRVQGRLEIAGTREKPVVLAPLSDDPTRDWWSGIELKAESGSGESRLAGCRILGADLAVAIQSGKATLDNCRIDCGGRVSVQVGRNAQLDLLNSQISGGYRQGLECERGSVLRMTGCQVVGLATGGVSLREVADQSSIKDTRIEKCGMDGIWVRGGGRPTIENCQIVGNARHGVLSIEGASPSVLDSQIRDNVGAGVYLKERWSAVLRGNTVTANRAGGIRAEVRCNGEITANRIEENVLFGLSLSLDCAPSISGNVVGKNRGTGLLLQNSQPKKLEGNQFIGNANGGLRNEGTGTVRAAGNWWGSDSESEVAKQIQSRASDPALGEVEFRPWLQTAPGTPATAPGR